MGETSSNHSLAAQFLKEQTTRIPQNPGITEVGEDFKRFQGRRFHLFHTVSPDFLELEGSSWAFISGASLTLSLLLILVVLGWAWT